jgi:AraC-like DNA-binding protein
MQIVSRPCSRGKFQDAFLARIASDSLLDNALNHLSNIYVAVKDASGRYVWVSDNLARRCGFATGAEMVEIDDFAFNPPRLAKKYRQDDRKVMRSGRPLLRLVEIVLNGPRVPDWNITSKFPLRDARGEVIGVIATVEEYPGLRHLPFFGDDLRAVVKHIFAHLSEPLNIPELAAIAGVSYRQIERRFRNAAGMSPTDFLIRARLDEACRRLQEGGMSIGNIALSLGFYDQCAFARLFRRYFGMTPSEFRQLCRRGTGTKPLTDRNGRKEPINDGVRPE